MSIEFRCNQCQRLLRTADNTAGKQTKCPECGTVVRIPGATQPVAAGPASPLPPRPAQPAPVTTPERPRPAAGNPFAAGTAMPPPGIGGTQNPYLSPMTPGSPFGAHAAAGAPGPLDVSDVMNRTWKIYTDNLGQLILGMFLFLLITIVATFGLLMVMAIGLGIGGALNNAGNEAAGVIVIVLSMVVMIAAMMVVMMYFTAGMIRWMLLIAKGEPASVGDLFSGWPYMGRLLGAGLLMSLIVMIGYMACIVPGIYLALIFSQFGWLIVDRKAGAMDSLSQSKSLTEGNRVSLFLLLLIIWGISLVGAFIPFAGLFTSPFIYLMMAVAYLRMSGQRTADMLMTSPVGMAPAMAAPPR
jgi:phage FluMu protein Com/uncharacterized membrane protein